MMVGGAIVNALAFSGSNYLFSSLQRGERERHDKAIEQLENAKKNYERRRIQRLDFLNEQLKRQDHALKTFDNVDEAMREYAKHFSQKLPPLGAPPTLSQFYNPSQPQQNGELIFITCGMAAVVGVVYYTMK